MRPLYFVSIRRHGETIFAGHWYACDASWARDIAMAEFGKGIELRVAHGLPAHDLIDESYVVQARRSTAYANALNESE